MEPSTFVLKFSFLMTKIIKPLTLLFSYNQQVIAVLSNLYSSRSKSHLRNPLQDPSIDDKYLVVTDCTYSVSVGWSTTPKQVLFREDECGQGTAIAINDHYFITAALMLFWEEDVRGLANATLEYLFVHPHPFEILMS